MATKTSHTWYPRRYQVVNGASDGPNAQPKWMAQPARRVDRDRTGVAVSNWLQKIQDGQNATSDMTAQFWSVVDEKPVVGSVYMRINQFSYWHTNSVNGHVLSYYTGFPAWTGFTSNAESQARAKLFKAVRDAETKLQGLVFLGELRETLRMLRRPLEGLQDLIQDYLTRAQALKRGKKPSQRRRYDQNLSKLWLEYAFGWTPLLADVEAARNAYNALFRKERQVKFSVGGKDFYRRAPNAYGTTCIMDGWPSYIRLDTGDVIHQTEIIRYRGVVRATATTTAQDRLARFGFSVKEFLPTAWELLPWSFLLDYFANIGDILEASVTDTSKVIWVSKSRVRIQDTERWGEFHNPKSEIGSGNVSSHSTNRGFVKYRQRYVQRWASPGVNLPELTFRLPHSPRKLVNIVALLDLMRRSAHPQNPRSWNYRID